MAHASGGFGISGDRPSLAGLSDEIRRNRTEPSFLASRDSEWDDEDVAQRAFSGVITSREKAMAGHFLFAPTIFSGKSVWVTWMMCLNAVVGSGVLGIPYAFAEAGLALSLVFLALITCLAMVTANYLVETQSRLQALVNLALRPARSASPANQGPNGSPGSPTGVPKLTLSKQDILRRVMHELHVWRVNKHGRALQSPPMPKEFRIMCDTRIFEVNELCSVFLGSRGKIFWEVSILLEVVTCLWLYCAMMGTTLLQVVPIPGLSLGENCSSSILSPGCSSAYKVWLGVIAMVLIPLTLRDLKDLGMAQILLTFVGYSCIGMMLISVCVAMFVQPYPGVHDVSGSPPYIAPQKMVIPGGFGLLFSTTVFTQMCHIAVPSLTQIIKEKKRIRRVVIGGMATTYVLYAVLGLLTNLYFGSKVAVMITLNWEGFAWTGSLGPITRMLNTLVVLLPFFTIANAFPLNAHALANNLMTSIHPKTWRALLGISEAQEGEEQPLTGGEAWPPMRVKVVARLMCTVPPFLLAAVQRDPSRIVTIIGIFGFVLMFFVPCLLQYYSVTLFQDIWPQVSKTIFRAPASAWFSEPTWVVAVVVLSSMGFVINFYNVVISLFPVQ